eukprot:g1053.t1
MLIPVIVLAAKTWREGGGGGDKGGRRAAEKEKELLENIRRLQVGGKVFFWFKEGDAPFKPSPRLKAILSIADATIGPFPSKSDVAMDWLEAGAKRVCFDTQSKDDVPSDIPRTRLAVIRSKGPWEKRDLLDLRELASLVVLVMPANSDAKMLDTIRSVRENGHYYERSFVLMRSPLHASASSSAKPKVGEMHGAFVDLAEFDVSLERLGRAIVACSRTDRPDGLFTTVVANRLGVALGLVYSSAESIVEAVKSGSGVYYSRSRKGLWKKGLTSGATQTLHGVSLDCDVDAIRFTVEQHGKPPAFCHEGTTSCWGDQTGLGALEETLWQRRESAPAKSYTKRLFDDPKLLRHKLLEEAQELSEARDPDHVAAEAADVLYFAMVACARAGVRLADVYAHLDRRSLKIKRRPGNAKPPDMRKKWEGVVSSSSKTA